MIKSTLKLVAAIVLFASCNQYEKAPSGMPYKITHGSGNEQPLKQGDYVKLNIEYKLKANDSVLSSTFGVIPVYFPVDTARLGKYTFTEVILKCRKGDKIEFSLSIDSLVKMGALQITNVFKANDLIIGRAEIINVFDNANLVDADYKKEQDIEKTKEIAAIEAYLAKNKITFTDDENLAKQIHALGSYQPSTDELVVVRGPRLTADVLRTLARSEERRVGKECRL
jgi:hypothetical protein